MGKMDVDVVVKGGEELKELHPKQYEKLENKIVSMICDIPGVGSVVLSNEPERSAGWDPDYPPWEGKINIIIDGGENLYDIDSGVYSDLTGKIRALVHEAFPKVEVGRVEAWSYGYYQGHQVREALAKVLEEGGIIGQFAAAIRNIRKEDEPLPDGTGVLKIQVPQNWLDFIDEYYRITGKKRDTDLMSNIWANIEGLMLDEMGGLSGAARDRLVKKYDLRDPSKCSA